MDNTKAVAYDDLFALTFNTIDDAILIHPMQNDGFGCFTLVNKSACKCYGYTKEEFYKLTPIDIEDVKSINQSAKKDDIAKLIAKKKLVSETWHITKSGRVFPVEINTSLFTYKNQEMLLTVAKDLSKQKDSERITKDYLNKIRGIFRVAPAGIGVVINRVFTEVNETVCKMTGYTKEELLGNASRMVYPTQKDYDIAGKIKYAQIAKKGTGSVETRWIKKDGQIINILLASTPADPNDLTRGVIFTAWDITKRKKQEEELENHKNNLEKLVVKRTYDLETINEELQATNEELYQQNKIIGEQKKALEENILQLKETQAQLIQSEKMASLGVLTAGVSHEMNNPLNFIKGVYLGLDKHFTELGQEKDEKIAFLLNSLKTGVERTSTIVNGLNQFSIENKKFDEDCYIHDIINNCLVILHNKLKHRAVLEKRFVNETIIVKGNVGKLHQVFSNILLNAIQAIIETGKITVITYIRNDYAVIEIEDTGVGISEKNLPKITDPFFTTKDPGKRHWPGLIHFVQYYSGS